MPVIAQVPYVVARLQDASESTAEMRVHVQHSASRAAGLAAGRQLAELAAAAGGTSAIEHVLRYPLMVTGTAPAPGADRRRYGVLVFRTDVEEQYAIVEIPGIKGELIDPNDETQLFVDAPALSNYIWHLTTNNYCNPFGYQLLECIAGLVELRQ